MPVDRIVSGRIGKDDRIITHIIAGRGEHKTDPVNCQKAEKRQ